MLLTWHNLHYHQDIVRGLPAAIETRALGPWIAAFEASKAWETSRHRDGEERRWPTKY